MKFKTFAFSILAIGSALSLTAQTPSGMTIINGRPLSDGQRIEFQLMYGTAPLPGAFWYDSRSGMWGYWGREVAGVLRPGHNFGPLSSDASNGRTGIFINGRQLNTVEAVFLFGVQARPGRLWLDGRTGYFGVEGNPQPLGNVAQAVQAQQKQRQPIWSLSELMGGSSNSAGTCTAAGNCYYPGQ